MGGRHHAAAANILTLGLVVLVLGACQDNPISETESETPKGELFQAARAADVVVVAAAELESPVRIALGKRRALFVSDFLGKAVVEFEVSEAGLESVRAFQIPGRPLGVAWTKNLLIVGNASTQSVDVYRSSNGKWVRSLGGPMAVSDPTDIAVDERARLVFVLDGQGRRVRVFALRDGRLLSTISGPGPGEFDLQNPTGIAVDPERREVVISDYGEPTATDAPPRIKIFDYDGTPLRSFSGKTGMLGQRFSRPQGLAVDAAGRILVVEAVAGEVLVLDGVSGATVEVLGSFGSGPGELWLPLDVVADNNRNVFVVNNRPRRVEIF